LVNNTSNWKIPQEFKELGLNTSLIVMYFNSLDLTPGSQNMIDIDALRGRGITVEY